MNKTIWPYKVEDKSKYDVLKSYKVNVSIFGCFFV